MQSETSPLVKTLVLVGGGHSHAIALKLWGMRTIAGVRLILISDTSHTPYSGMLPGLVAGFYSYDQTHIDLRRLARWAGAEFYKDRAVGLDLETNQVICQDHPPVSFDLLSLNLGSTPKVAAVPGAKQYAIPAKPVPVLLAAWEKILQQVKSNPQQRPVLAIVGGGAGGVELALNMRSRLQQLGTKAQIHLFHRDSRLLPNHNRWVSQKLEKILTSRGIRLHLNQTVSEIKPGKVICESGLTVESESIFWVTQASAPPSLAASGLATDKRGFVLVDDTLQSVSHPSVFAAGDIATMVNYSRPKAGVFAVRQGKPLWQNLRNWLQGKGLVKYQPQSNYLALIGTGDRQAIASWNQFGWYSPWLWRWKDHIDRKFMHSFEDLPPMKPSATTTIVDEDEPTPSMRCAGCGSKVGSTVLSKVLGQLKIYQSEAVKTGIDAPDDAAIIEVSNPGLLVQTVDYFTSPLNDPYIFGQITAHHCLNDLWAMGATPQTALAIVTVPVANSQTTEAILTQLLGGVTKTLAQHQVALVGGHTTQGSQLALGLSCQGWVKPQQILAKSQMQPNQAIILTKAIGTGTLLAAEGQLQAKGRWIDGAVASMLQSNQAAAEIFTRCGATACTDVTGFGLIGHLVEMIRASGVEVEIDWGAIPILQGAELTVAAGITSSLQPQNLQAAAYISNWSEAINQPQYPLLFDPQTAGGLVASVPAEQASECLKQLHQAGYGCSCVIGRVVINTVAPKISIKLA